MKGFSASKKKVTLAYNVDVFSFTFHFLLIFFEKIFAAEIGSWFPRILIGFVSLPADSKKRPSSILFMADDVFNLQ